MPERVKVDITTVITHRSALCMTLALCALLITATVATQPIYVGTFSYHTYRDPTTNQNIDGFLEPFFSGLKSAALAINTAGGIHGKQIQLIECETGFVHSKYLDCMDQWKAQYYPNMLAIVSVLHDQVFNVMMPKLEAQNIMLIDPMVSGDIGRPPKTAFSDKWVFLTADSRLQIISLVKKAVNGKHFRRVAFLSSTDAAEEKEAELIEILADLNVTYVGSFSVLPSASNGTWVWPSKAYTEFLALGAQAMITFMSPDARNLDVLVDILNQSYYGTNNVDPNVVLLGAAATNDILIGAAYLIQAVHRVPIRLKDRIFFTTNTPLMADSRYNISQHASADATTYFGTGKFIGNGTSYLVHLQQTWIQMQFVAAVARRMQPTNLTKDAFIDTVFDSGSFPVDDVLFGMFSRGCSGMRKVLDMQCQCGQGFRIVELYTLSPLLTGVIDPAAEAVTPFTSCGSASLKVPYPLVYTSLNGSDALTTAAVRASVFGILAQEQVVKSSWEDSTKFVPMPSPLNRSSFAANVSRLNNDRYISALVGCVLPAYDLDVSGLPLIDPLVFPAQLAPTAFQMNLIHLSATLQQEIHALAELAVKNGWGLSIHVRSSAASDVIAAVTKSLNTFGSSPSASTVMSPLQPLVLGQPASNAVFVSGVVNAADVDVIAQFMTTYPTVVVMLPFSEVAVLYDYIVSVLNTTMLAKRLVFATSMRNWNAPNMSSNQLSPLMQAFFSKVPSSRWTPLTLRGFIASAAVQQILQQIRTAYTPYSILKELYSTSVIALSSADFLGAFSSSRCFSAEDTVCQTNMGARSVNVMSLADVTLNATNTQGYQSSTVFTSGRIDYQPLPSSSSLSTAAIIGIAVGASIGGLLLIALVVWSRSGGRDNKNAPKDPSSPVTLIFTDIQSSTGLWAATPDVMARSLEVHHELIRVLIHRYKCYEVKTIGDSFMIACSTPESAVRLAVELQKLFFAHDWKTCEIDEAYREFEREKSLITGVAPPTAELPIEIYSKMWNGIRVRIGIRTGMAEIKFDEITRGYDYYGSVSNVAARTESSGHGGQIVITKSTLNALGDHAGEFTITPLGATELRGVPDPVELFQVASVPDRKFLELKRDDGAVDDDDDDENDSTIPSTASTKEKYLLTQQPPRNLSSTDVQGAETAHDGDPTGDDVTSMTSGSKGGIVGPSDWRAVSIAFLTILLSTCSDTLRKSVLDVLCERWHVQVSGVHTGRLRDDPYLLAVSKRIAPMMKKKCGNTVLAGNFTKPLAGQNPTGKQARKC